MFNIRGRRFKMGEGAEFRGLLVKTPVGVTALTDEVFRYISNFNIGNDYSYKSLIKF